MGGKTTQLMLSGAPHPAQLSVSLGTGGEDVAVPPHPQLVFLLSSFILWDIIPCHIWFFPNFTYFTCFKKLESVFCFPLVRLWTHFYFQFFLLRFCRGRALNIYIFFSCTKRRSMQGCPMFAGLWLQFSSAPQDGGVCWAKQLETGQLKCHVDKMVNCESSAGLLIFWPTSPLNAD